MAKLTDTQLVVLSAGSQRPGYRVLPLPERIRGGAAKKVVAGLLSRGLVQEVEADRDDPIHREAEDGQRLTLAATEAALAALGVEPDTAPERATEAAPAEQASNGGDVGDAAPAATQARTPREGTKQARLIAMLETPEGASIAEITEATGWQPHTVRGAIAGALKKRLGLDVTSDKVEGRGRVYRIGA